jgi:hypothetical protein
MEGSVGEANGRVVGVVKERGVRFKDASTKEGVGSVNGAAEAEGGVYPEERLV